MPIFTHVRSDLMPSLETTVLGRTTSLPSIPPSFVQNRVEGTAYRRFHGVCSEEKLIESWHEHGPALLPAGSAGNLAVMENENNAKNHLC